ncbi:hypothetical protein K491DRAFT_685753 [Lophiostoma macrostomum CBS 122681]|uniref:Uncharacterized protein n=1 Tax=Lophiostoma macrostomum CBS 122681 TaxID=1314788 RepID=A0A6A6SLB9_9PLEO|nr:hypothetical protein K491DRAFT_685753 [Lophiostoma macrostomum CBS 122681]
MANTTDTTSNEMTTEIVPVPPLGGVKVPGHAAWYYLFDDDGLSRLGLIRDEEILKEMKELNEWFEKHDPFWKSMRFFDIPDMGPWLRGIVEDEELIASGSKPREHVLLDQDATFKIASPPLLGEYYKYKAKMEQLKKEHKEREEKKKEEWKKLGKEFKDIARRIHSSWSTGGTSAWIETV